MIYKNKQKNPNNPAPIYYFHVSVSQKSEHIIVENATILIWGLGSPSSLIQIAGRILVVALRFPFSC